MDQLLTVTAYAAIIFLVSLLASRLPFLIRRDHGRLHRLISFSAGIMLGVLFVMLMPEALERTTDGGYGGETAAYWMLAGFLLLFILDCLVKHYTKVDCDCDECREYREHDITSLSAFAGLAIHSFFDGLALAAAFLAGESVGIMVLVAMCLHKTVVVFSLSSTMLMSNRRRQAWYYLIAFCAISPLATIVSYLCLDGGNLGFTGPALCLSVGIFMFVTLCDMLPEAFHERERDLRSLGLLLLGLAVVILVALATTALTGGAEI